jgi:hypothetical protein
MNIEISGQRPKATGEDGKHRFDQQGAVYARLVLSNGIELDRPKFRRFDFLRFFSRNETRILPPASPDCHPNFENNDS